MPTYVFGLLLLIAPEFFRPLNESQALGIILRLSIVTLLLPALSISILKFTGYIGSVHLEERGERLMPYLFTALYYGVMTYIFYRGMSFHPFFILMSSITGLIILLTIINLWIKISAHSSSIVGTIGFLWAMKLNDPDLIMVYPIIALIVITGVVMSSRLKLNAHKPIEIYLGAIIGFVACFCGAFFFL